MTKEKLTLSVDKEVVKKAKKLGINISEITEKVLGGFTFTLAGVDESYVRAKYRGLFDTMLPLLKKYSVGVKVATVDFAPQDLQKEGYEGPVMVELCPDGTLAYEFASDWEEIPFEKISVVGFHPPKQILSDFIEAISEASERAKENLKELEMVKRIIEAIAGSPGKTPRKGRK